MQLYVYDHCPFCVKARMIFGLHQQAIELIIPLNDDEQTPVQLIGKKMLPILVKDDGQAMGESLDIVAYVEQINQPCLSQDRSPQLAAWLTRVNGYLSKLLYPILASSGFAEFATPSARYYFVEKKQAIAGNFAELHQQRPMWVEKINLDLQQLAEIIQGAESVNSSLSLDDIHLFPVLRALTLVREVTWPDRVAQLRDALAKRGNIPLLFDLAR